MTGLSAPDRTKLARVLALLGSDQAGERDAAGLAAHRLIRAAGVTWAQALGPQPAGHRAPEIGTWRQTVRDCLQHPGSLRKWEAKFLADLHEFRHPSPKQRHVLAEIADRVLKRGAA